MGRRRITVKPSEVGPGFYVVFGSDLGVVGFFKVKDHSAQYAAYPGLAEADPMVIWGLSRWRGRVAYRTLGISFRQWMERQGRGVQIRPDRDRTGWPVEAVS